MRIYRCRAAEPLSLLVLGICLFLSFTRTGYTAPSIDDFVKDEAFVHHARLSPDGSHLAIVRPVDGIRHLIIFKIAEGQLTPASAHKLQHTRVYDVHWVNDNRILAFLWPYNPETGQHYRQTIEGKSIPKFYLPQLLAVDVDGSRPVVLLEDEKKFRYTLNKTNIENYLRDDPEHVLMSVSVVSRGRGFESLNVYKVNVYTGEVTVIEEGNPNTYEWHTDYQGNVRLRLDGPFNISDVDWVYWGRSEPGGEWTEFLRHHWREKAPFEVLNFSRRPGILYIRAPKDDDKYAIYEYDVRTRKQGKLVFSHPNVSIDGGVYALSDGALVGARYTLHKGHVTLFDKAYQALETKLNNSFGKTDTVSVLSWSRDRKRMVLKVTGPRQPGVNYLYDVQTNRAVLLGHTNPDIDPRSLGTMRPLTYKARDGSEITAYFTTPAGNPAKPPLVVMPHGGPHVRDSLDWNPWIQFLATRGYAVLQPNFRGSRGYGKKFEKAGYKQWGLKMQDDVTDGVKHVIEQGLVDGSRVCILGASYGGYAALAGAAFTPELYRCAISFNGIGDVKAMLGYDRREGDRMGYILHWGEALGDVFSSEDMKRLEEVSPFNHVDKIRAPIMLIAGEYDSTVRHEQSEWMASALKKAGKPYELHLFEREGHDFERIKNRKEVLRLFDVFLRKHNGPKTASN